MISLSDNNSFTPHRRNYILSSHRKDGLIEWMKDMLNHSFVLNATDSYHETMLFFEELIDEHRHNREASRLKTLVPTVGKFHTSLAMAKAFKIYDEKYSISKRKMIPPSVNEIRHILNLAQVIALGKNLRMISFDGDQTLYTDGGNFDNQNQELALALIRLLCHNVKVVLVTAAGYGLDAAKYEYRLQELLNRFVEEQMTDSQVENFYVLGGECHYLFQCRLVNEEETVEVTLTEEEAALEEASPTSEYQEHRKTEEETSPLPPPPPPSASSMERDPYTGEVLSSSGSQSKRPVSVPPLSLSSSVSPPTAEKEKNPKKRWRKILTQRARLLPVPFEEWQSEHLSGPKPYYWPKEEVQTILDIAENTMRQTVEELKLRAKVLRKEKAVGVFPGGKEMAMKYPIGHGSKKLKQEALDEIVLRVMEAIRQCKKHHQISLPYCVFNGGRDAWIDIGNKSVGVAALQAYFQCTPSQCLHVGDQVS